MNLGGSTSQLPALEQRPFGSQTQRAMTNQQARPVPLLYGKQRLGATFISDVFALNAQAVTQSVGKQQEQVGNNYYASFAAVICHGPVDGLYGIFLNGDPVYTTNDPIYAAQLTSEGESGDTFYTATFQAAGPHGMSTGDIVVIEGADQPAYNGEFTITVVSPTQFQYEIAPTDAYVATTYEDGGIYAEVTLNPVFRDEDNPDFVVITIPNYGTMTLYWGTETQPQDAFLNNNSGVTHPPYRGMCWIVFNNLFFGFNQTNVPNVELVLSRAPLPDWASLEEGDINNEANPAYVIADLYQNPRNGLALPDDEIDTTGLDAAAVGFNNEGLGVSNPLSRAQDLRSLLIALCETVDAMPLLSAEGFLSIFPIRPPADIDDLPTIVDADLSDLPQFTPADWTTTYSVTWATFANAELEWQDDQRGWRDQGQLNVIRNPDVLIVDRKWITDSAIAQAVANAAGQAAAIPLITGKLKLRYSDDMYAQMAPGSMFLINFSLRPAENVIFRVTDRSIAGPDNPEIDIEFQADRTYLYTALIDAMGGGSGGESEEETLPDVPAPAVIPANTRLLLFELPPALCPGAPAIGAIVARNATAMISFGLYLKKNYAWSGAAPDSYALVGTQTKFAFHGLVQNDYPLLTRVIDLEVGLTVQLDGPDLSLNPITAFEALSDTTLCFVDQEIMSLAGWKLISSGQYLLQLVRGRFGTPIQEHEAGARVLIINKADLAVITSPAFQPDNCAAIKITLGGQPASAVQPINTTLAGNAWRVPPPAAVAINGSAFVPTFPGGNTAMNISWVLPDPGGALPRTNLLRIYTRLEVYIGVTADQSNVTVDSTNITADGGKLPLTPTPPVTADNSELTADSGTITADDATLDVGNMKKIYSVDVPWPATSFALNFNAKTSAQDQNFVLRATTVVDMGWKPICSATATALEVFKYP